MTKFKMQTKGGAPVLALCLVVMLALAAVTAASASAKLPEWGGCEAAAHHEGVYADSNCTVPVKKVDGKYTGGYEWDSFEKYLEATEQGAYSFEGGTVGATTFETTTGKQIACPVGELHYLGMLPGSGKDAGELWVTLYGCESEGQPCRSEFHYEGEITDQNEWEEGEGLKGELVYLSGKNTLTPSVGLTLTVFKPGQPLFTVVCNGAIGSLEIGGAGGKKTEKPKGNAAISVIAPVDQMTTEYTQTFTQTAGVQEPLKAEKGKERSLQMFIANTNTWLQLGLATSWTLPAESGRPPIEIKAVR